MFMKKVLIFLICLIGYQIGCHAQMAGEHYYQNFYEFPKFRIKLLILILLHFNIVRIIY